ncbi:carboxypeptidase regulatory-like domain-containing protein [Petrotoga sp. 9PWA.NaAc.5.4]|uniref:carboxypeptidase regulatory-like domain-containing protein n=1 Tax=Petrotoga sp. 9PWA.NaAc.5.4 TaxID=1434328 RepID=UPI000CC6928F|nr:carboxypeptidase regulatory-like domain-containing protein [Petrotoga sp. 9PWA.NaAc.5.4]PNR96823.1 hypothetical protein X924_02020 [Petrotoga sp. 9PWA.NaAc.5.4]
MKKRFIYFTLLFTCVIFILSGCSLLDFGGLFGGTTGTVTGIVTDATNGQPINGATVKSGDISATTGADGKYTLNKVPTSNTTIQASKSGYIALSYPLSLAENEQKVVNFALSPALSANETFRIVLTWGQDPRDLDSHLLVPTSDSNASQGYHIYYNNRGTNNSDQYPYAYLDIDDTTSFGPETVTIYRRLNQPYKYYVHHYAGTGQLNTSSAVVSIYNQNGLVKTYNVPSSGTGLYWYVFDITANGQIVDRNVIQENAPTL